ELARGTGPGAHLYTNSTLAIDPDSGRIVWHFQHLPGDNWNLDHAFERVLVDVESGGELKRMRLTAGKTSIVWALDRKTGKYLWHRETVHQNVISRIDPGTGEVTLNRRAHLAGERVQSSGQGAVHAARQHVQRLQGGRAAADA